MTQLRLQLWPTLVALPALAVLLALGFWQLDRLAWKEALVADIDARVVAAPVPLPDTLTADDRYRKVVVTGVFDHGREVRSHTISPTLGMGNQLLTPLQRTNGAWILVSRGFVGADVEDILRPQGPVEITGLLRVPGGGNAFTPAPNAAKKQLYAVDIAAAEGLMGFDKGTLPPLYVEAGASPEGTWPKGAQTLLVIKNDHLEYALTWFGLALTLIGVYIAWHVKAARDAQKG